MAEKEHDRQTWRIRDRALIEARNHPTSRAERARPCKLCGKPVVDEVVRHRRIFVSDLHTGGDHRFTCIALLMERSIEQAKRLAELERCRKPAPKPATATCEVCDFAMKHCRCLDEEEAAAE